MSDSSIAERYEYKEYTVSIHFDTVDGLNPRIDWDNFGTMVCFHGRYILGDKDHGYRTEDYLGWDAMKKAIIEEEDAVAVLPLFLYDHGGITISVGGFGCQFDSGQVGFIFARRADVVKEFGENVDDETLAKVDKLLRGEVESYDSYLRGEVYGYVVGNEDDDHIESCWGFIGDAKYCKQEAEGVVDWLVEEDIKNKAAQKIEIKERDERRRKMGYDFDLIESQIFVSKEKFADFRARAVDLGNVADDISVDVSDEQFVSEIFRNHGFTAILDEPGNLVDVEQACEKLISQAQLLDAVAPFCAEGNFVGAYGEDGEIWRWSLDPEKGMREEKGRIVYGK